MGDCHQQQRGEGDEGAGDGGLGPAGQADHGHPERGGRPLSGSLLQPHLRQSHQAESSTELRSFNRSFLCLEATLTLCHKDTVKDNKCPKRRPLVAFDLCLYGIIELVEQQHDLNQSEPSISREPDQ